MALTNIPKRPAGDNEESRYMQAIWDCVFGGKFPFVQTDKVSVASGPSGYRIEITPERGDGGQFIYVKACLNDGSEAFLKLRVYAIYALNTGTVTAPTINPGSVPDGAKVLE